MTPTASAQPPSSKALTISLWLVQVLLALAFGMAGFMKLATPIAELAAKMSWAGEMPGLVRFIGLSEVAGALGLILPAASRIKPALTPLAASGLVVIMVLAAGYHVVQGEFQAVPACIVLGALAGFITWGRTKKAPIAPR